MQKISILAYDLTTHLPFDVMMANDRGPDKNNKAAEKFLAECRLDAVALDMSDELVSNLGVDWNPIMADMGVPMEF